MELAKNQVVRHMVTRTEYVITGFPLVKLDTGEWCPGVRYEPTSWEGKSDGTPCPDEFVRTREGFEERFIEVV